MKKILSAAAVALLSTTQFSGAVVIGTQTITEMHEVVDYVTQHPEHFPLGDDGKVLAETVVVFDWDKTLGKESNDLLPVEPDDNGTLDSIVKLHNMGIKSMVMTSRQLGVSLDGKDAIGRDVFSIYSNYDYCKGATQEETISNIEASYYNDADIMKKTFDGKEGVLDSWIRNGALKDVVGLDEQKLEKAEGTEYDSGEDCVAEFAPSLITINPSLAFCGVDGGTPGSPMAGFVKGRAIEQLIEGGYFKVNPDTLIFIDDQSNASASMRWIFKKEDRPEKLHNFIYLNPSQWPK